MRRSIGTLVLLALCISAAGVLILDRANAVGFTTQVFRAAAIGYAVKQASPGLNKFINTVTFRGKSPGVSTKVVPILSVGEKGYVGAAQVAGSAAAVKSVQAVWLYEDNFSQNEFRLKVLVPSASLNPLTLKRVQKVGLSAVIDVSLDGAWKGQTYNRALRVGDVLKAGVVAVAVSAAAKPINTAINTITGGSSASTKVVPIATIGDKAYIGGAQVSGAAIKSVKAVYQYEDIFDGGKFRIKAFVPADSTNPLKIKRVAGAGVTALIDTSIADQRTIREREPHWRGIRASYSPMGAILGRTFRGDIERHDQGLHKGWYIGKGNQRKLLTGAWVERYESLNSQDRDAFVIWWNSHHSEKPDILEVRWREWKKDREKAKEHVQIRMPGEHEEKSKGKSEGQGKGKGKD